MEENKGGKRRETPTPFSIWALHSQALQAAAHPSSRSQFTGYPKLEFEFSNVTSICNSKLNYHFVFVSER